MKTKNICEHIYSFQLLFRGFFDISTNVDQSYMQIKQSVVTVWLTQGCCIIASIMQSVLYDWRADWSMVVWPSKSLSAAWIIL